MSANNKVSNRIRDRREDLGMLRMVIAELSGLAYARYCSIERGDVQITVADLSKIAPALQTTVIWLCRDLCNDLQSECDIPAGA